MVPHLKKITNYFHTWKQKEVTVWEPFRSKHKQHHGNNTCYSLQLTEVYLAFYGPNEQEHNFQDQNTQHKSNKSYTMQHVPDYNTRRNIQATHSGFPLHIIKEMFCRGETKT